MADLEHLMLGLSVGSLSQRFALDLNFQSRVHSIIFA